MTALSHWPDKDDARAMARMTYPDGTRIDRGDLVRVDGRPEAGACTVIGWRPLKWRVKLISPALGPIEEEPCDLSGACVGPTERAE